MWPPRWDRIVPLGVKSWFPRGERGLIGLWAELILATDQIWPLCQPALHGLPQSLCNSLAGWHSPESLRKSPCPPLTLDPFSLLQEEFQADVFSFTFCSWSFP